MLICLILITTLCSIVTNSPHPGHEEIRAPRRLSKLSNSQTPNGPGEILKKANPAPEFAQDRSIQNNSSNSDCVQQRNYTYIFPLLLISTTIHFSNLTSQQVFFCNVYSNQQLQGTKNLPEVCLLYIQNKKCHSLLGGENLCHLGNVTERCVELTQKLNSPWTPQTLRYWQNNLCRLF